MQARRNGASLLRAVTLAVCGFFVCGLFSGCLVAGVSSTGGGFIWPGGLGLVVIVLVILFLLRRR